MPTKVSPLRKEKQSKLAIQNYDELNTVKVPVTALRFELADMAKKGMTEYPLGDLLLTIQMLVRARHDSEDN